MVGGRYLIHKLIATGGQGAVYQGADTRLNHARVAIKEMAISPYATDPAEYQSALERFKQEAELLRRLSHPNLPRVYDLFEDAGRQYLVMDFIEGRTLRDVLDSSPRPLLESDVIHLGQQLCNVLEYLHAQNPSIVYRDLNPRNVMLLLDDKTIKLIDFGIARFYKPSKPADTVRFGTPGYAPPEQYKGQTDARSDIYALGVTLHELLTKHDPGNNPFQVPSARSLNPRLSAQIEQVLSHATQLDPNARYQTAAQMRQALGNCLTSGVIVTPPPPRRIHLQSGTAALGALILITLIGLAAILAPKVLPSTTATPAPGSAVTVVVVTATAAPGGGPTPIPPPTVARPTTPPTAVPPTATPPPTLRPAPQRLDPDRVTASGSATSSRDSQGNTTTFVPENATDGQAQTCWRVPGDGRGAWLRLEFPTEVVVD